MFSYCFIVKLLVFQKKLHCQNAMIKVNSAWFEQAEYLRQWTLDNSLVPLHGVIGDNDVRN